MEPSIYLREALDAAIHHLADAKPMLPMYAHLLVAALFPIYAGAHASLSRPSSAGKPEKRDRSSNDEAEDEDDDVEEDVQQLEGMSATDAIVFPIMAGVVLTGLYLLMKRYGADTINAILNVYFSIIGVASLSRFFNDTLTVLFGFLFPTYFASQETLMRVDSGQSRFMPVKKRGQTWSGSPIPWLLLPKSLSRALWALRAAVTQPYTTRGYVRNLIQFKANITLINLFSVTAGLVTVISAYFWPPNPWWLTNLQGTAVCYCAFLVMSPTSFSNGSLVLCGLFFYDIYMVFFTPMMVAVATSLDVPIKLLFPKPDQTPETPESEPPKSNYSMLGLGDIVLPGIMIAFALRFDLYMFYLRKQRAASRSKSKQTDVIKAPYARATGGWGDWFWTLSLARSELPARLRSFPKTYFYASIIGYIVGMVVTVAVMTIYDHAQPALLYLVPGVLISLWCTGLVRGELSEMWTYTEAINGEQVDPEQQDDKPQSKEEEGASKKSDESKNDHDDPDSPEKGTLMAFSVVRRAVQSPSPTADKPKRATRRKSSAASEAKDDEIIVHVAGSDQTLEPRITRSRASTRHRRVAS